MRSALLCLIGVLLVVAICWFGSLYLRIRAVASRDEARPADAIAVFGAAEYDGRPSPVLHARLDHAVQLYNDQIAPLIITLGGGEDKHTGNTEAGVGRDYLLANGIPYSKIITESHTFDTQEQVDQLALIARAQHLRRIVVVSDATHLFRIRKICWADGLEVYTSPRAPYGRISSYDRTTRMEHEMMSYTALVLHLNQAWIRKWIEGRPD